MKNLIILCVLLTGCATAREPIPDPPPQVTEVRIPYAVPCVKKSDIPVMPPTHSSADLLKLSDYDLIQAIHYDRLILAVQNKKLEAALVECVKDDSTPQ